MHRFRKTLTIVLMAAIFSLSLPMRPAQASLLGTETLLQQSAERQQLRDFLKRADVLAQMEKLGIPCGPVHDLAEVFASDQVRARGMKVSIPDLGSKDNAVSLIGNPIKMSKPPSLMTVHPHVVVPIPKRF